MTTFNPKAIVPDTYNGAALPNAGENVALRDYETEGTKYGRIALVIPYGIGTRIFVTPYLNLSVEGGFRLTTTDYMDDVSDVHVDPASFSDPTAAALADRRPEIGLEQVAAGRKRGNPGSKDSYFTFVAKVEYYLPQNFLSNVFPNKLKSIKVKRRRRR